MITGYLKWENEIVGEIRDHDTLCFVQPALNAVTRTVIGAGTKRWGPAQYQDFLRDRIVSEGRRDIETLLYGMGLTAYDPVRIAEITRALNPKDLFWVSTEKDAAFPGAYPSLCKSGQRDAAHTPDGQNSKFYTVSEGRCGLAKQRLHPLSTDAESEVAVSRLGRLFGVQVCPAWFLDGDTVFSAFVCNFSREPLAHVRSVLGTGERTDDLYRDLIGRFPAMKTEIRQMCLLDFLTRQDDRHLCNLAVTFRGEEMRPYPLYDNGCSLFYEDREDFVRKALKDIPLYATGFGPVGTYWDAVEKIAETNRVSELIDIHVSEAQVRDALRESRFRGYRLDGACGWIMGALSALKRRSCC